MKAIILNGARKGETSLDVIHSLLLEQLTALGWESEPFILRKLDIAYCQADLDCWFKTPGACTGTRTVNQMANAMIHGDLAILLTPVTFGGYSSELKKALDHFNSLVLPFLTRIDGEARRSPRYAHYPRLLGIGALPAPDPESEAIFKELVKRNANTLHAPSHAASVVYETQRRHEIRTHIAALIARVEAMA
ncbi:MAG: NAD(P)H-dependent oxidoreductase [Anaerolineae bacterium]